MKLKHFSVKSKRQAAVLLLVLGLALSGFGLHFQRVEAAPNDVIINELMYNPGSDDQNEEFLELYNTTGDTVNLEGWCFTSGIDLCFSAGMTINANSYAVVSPDSSQTQSTYGVTPLAVYSGSLSNGGETITLEDDSSNIVSSITYSDSSPWPTSPDGGGPSLELKDPSFDNTNATNWGASLSEGGTPGQENSLVGFEPPTISNVTDPNDVEESTDVTISATVTDADSVTLIYKIGFEEDQEITMYDDGNHNDGAASDNVYAATIPGQASATLVRYKIAAENEDGETTSPSNDDSINYHGYTIADPSVTSVAPILNWYIADADYTDMHENHVFDNVYLPAVLAYGDTVYDNVEVRIKGEISRSYTKKSYKFKLPSGYSVDVEGGSDRAIREFHLNGEFKSATMAAVPTAWWVVEQVGLPYPDIIPMRLQRNGAFEGMYMLAEKYEDEWRQEKGYDQGELYEDYNEIVDGADDSTNIDAWRDGMSLDRKDPNKRDFILDNNDIPNIISFMSAKALLSSWDHYMDTNMFQHRHAETQRWSIFFWDLDSAFTASRGSANLVSPFEMEDFRPPNAKFALQAVYEQADLRSMYLRRLRTLTDKLYTSDAILNKYQEFADLYEDEMAADLAKWPADETSTRTNRSGEEAAIAGIKEYLLTYLRVPWAIPAAQTQAERQAVSIEEAVPNVNNQDEYIIVTNASAAYVDISGWQIEGIDYTIPAGVVVPAGGRVYFVRDDAGYRSSHDSVFIAGQYTNDLNDINPSELTLKTDTGEEIDSYDF